MTETFFAEQHFFNFIHRLKIENRNHFVQYNINFTVSATGKDRLKATFF